MRAASFRLSFAPFILLALFASSALAGEHGHKSGSSHQNGPDGIRNFDSNRLLDGIGRDQRNDFFSTDRQPNKTGGLFGHGKKDNVQTATGGPFENVYRDFISLGSGRTHGRAQTGTGGPLGSTTVVTTTGGPFLNVTEAGHTGKRAKH